jgi:hypothetical protein
MDVFHWVVCGYGSGKFLLELDTVRYVEERNERNIITLFCVDAKYAKYATNMYTEK